MGLRRLHRRRGAARAPTSRPRSAATAESDGSSSSGLAAPRAPARASRRGTSRRARRTRARAPRRRGPTIRERAPRTARSVEPEAQERRARSADPRQVLAADVGRTSFRNTSSSGVAAPSARCARISSRVPWATMRPRSMTATSSHRRSTTSSTCVVKNRVTPRGGQAAQEVGHHAAGHGVDAVQRLVEEEHRRPVDERAGEGQLLAHALRVVDDQLAALVGERAGTRAAPRCGGGPRPCRGRACARRRAGAPRR